jgi:uncharacterized protein YeaO (DUF488 family)
MTPTIQIKRAYEKPADSDGFRVLVDRLWPRGIAKDEARLQEWAKDLAPSTELRNWFNHDPALWTEFEHKYLGELKKNEAVKAFVHSHSDKKVITLVYGAKDEAHNQAVVLRAFLTKEFG